MIHDTFKRFMQTLKDTGLCEDLRGGVHLSYAGETNFYKFTDDFKVFDHEEQDITASFDWNGRYTCTFLFTIYGLFVYEKNGETHYRIQVKVKQMKVYDTSALDNNTMCLL